MNESQLKEIIMKTISELMAGESEDKCASCASTPTLKVEDGEVPDLSAVDYRKVIDVPNPANGEEYLHMRSKTVARLGVWRAGPRYRTNTSCASAPTTPSLPTCPTRSWRRPVCSP